MKHVMVFRECLEALIVCTGNGEIVLLHGRDNTVGEIKKYPTIMLEAVASQDLWIWHAFFGMAGANNNINVLDNSPLFDDLLNDTAPVLPYEPPFDDLRKLDVVEVVEWKRLLNDKLRKIKSNRIIIKYKNLTICTNSTL
ncbi:ALP1-like protein [Tanacetum coccineum]